MSAKFTFILDRARGLVRIGMHGFYGLEDVAAFFDARRMPSSACRSMPM